MKTRTRRLISLILTFVMFLSLYPVSTAMAWDPPATLRIVRDGELRSLWTWSSGIDMETGFYNIEGSADIAYCVDAEANSPNGDLYDFNDSALGNQNYLNGIQAIIQHGYPYSTGGLSAVGGISGADQARYATQAAIHFLENVCMDGDEGWNDEWIPGINAGSYGAALTFAQQLLQIGINQTVLNPRIEVGFATSWQTNSLDRLFCNVPITEIDTDYWSVTSVPAGVSVEGGNVVGSEIQFSGDLTLTLYLDDPVAYNQATSHALQIQSYSRRGTENIHVFDISQHESDKTLQKMVCLKADLNADPTSVNLPAGMGELQIYKVTRTMDRGDVPEANATFVLYPTTYASYEAAVAAGAPTGTVTTDTTGFGTSTPLPLGDYVLHQTVAPRGTFPIADQVVTVKVYGPTDPPNSYFNEQGDGYVDVQKFTRLGSVRFPEVGAIFEVRNASNVVVDTLTTGVTGYDRSILLPYGNYTLVQTFAPVGTVIDTTVRSFEIGVDDSGNAAHADVVYFDIDNQITQGTVEIHKTTNLSVDVPEANAIFQVFPSVYATYTDAVNSGAICSLVTTDATGYARTGLLPYGTYTVHQSSVPAGTIPVADLTVTVGAVNNDNQVLNLINDTYWGDIEIQKYRAPASDPDNRTVEPGATFVIYPAAYANYAAALAGDPKAADTCDVITTGADGIGRSTHLLPYGTYTCEQISSAATADTFLVQPWTVTIGATANQHYTYERTNEIYEQYLKIVKTDADTGLVIPLAGASFQILAADQETILSDSTGKSEFTTDITGTVNLSDLPLLVGTYYIRETKAPTGYTLNTNLVTFTVSMADHGSSVVTVDLGKDIRSEDFANERQTCSLSVEKQGETLITAAKVDAKDMSGNLVTDGDGNQLSVYDFYYDQRPMNGAVFMVYAGEEDIVDVNGVILYRANAWVGTMTTSAVTQPDNSIKYIATMDDLPLGADGTAQYIVRETTAPIGQTLAANPLIFDFAYADQTISVISQGKAMQDSKQDIAIAVEKQKEVMTRNASTGNYETSIVAAQGIVFGLYTTNDILSPNGTVIVKKDSLVDLLITGADGKATSTKDLPFGQYYAKELKVTEGVVWDKTSVWPLTVSPDTDGETEIVTVALNNGQPIVNRSIKGVLEIYKVAGDTNLPMSDVEFDVYDKDANLVDRLITNELGLANTIVLPYGEYTLVETKTNTGYALGENKSFVIERSLEDGTDLSSANLTLVNQKLALLQVYKVTENTETPMHGVVFGVYDARTDRELARMTTDNDGYAEIYLTPGELYLKELSTWDGFALINERIQIRDMTFGAIYTFRLTNDYTSLEVNKQSTDGKFLEGMEFSVINDANGEVIPLCYDTLNKFYLPAAYTDDYPEPLTEASDFGVTGPEGSAYIRGLLPGSYSIKETRAPEGYLIDPTPQKFAMDGLTTVITLVNAPIPPKTGEMTKNYPIWIILFGAASILFAVIVSRKKQGGKPHPVPTDDEVS